MCNRPVGSPCPEPVPCLQGSLACDASPPACTSDRHHLAAVVRDVPLSLGSVEELAREFARLHLEEYATQLATCGHPPNRKEINDSLWGTIALSALEVAVLDSPLVQRLRYVRQLGVVHWVYPGAVHTRFEHSLGVMHQVARLAATINAIGLDRGYGMLVEPSTLQVLRLAALLHDVGHAAFSHVSETAVAALPGLDAISADFSAAEGVEGRSLSEIFAYYVLRSPAMRRFMGVMHDKYPTALAGPGSRGDNVNGTIDRISYAVR